MRRENKNGKGQRLVFKEQIVFPHEWIAHHCTFTDDMVKIKGGIGDNTNLVLQKLSTQIQEPLSLLDALLIKIDRSEI